MTEVTKTIMARRRAALRVHGHGSVEYRELNRQVRSAIRRDARDDVQGRIQLSRGRDMWRCFRSIVGDSKGERKIPDATPDQLNQFFC